MSNEFQSLIDCLEDGVFIIDRECHILQCNAATRRNLLKADSPGIGQLCYEAIPCQFLSRSPGERECPARRVFATGQSVHSTYSCDVTGQLRWYDILTTPLRSDAGEIDRVIEIWRDISEIKQIEADFHEEVRRREWERSRLLGRIIHAQEEERKRVARELHDETSQALTALTLSVQGLLEKLPLEESSLRVRLGQLTAGIGDVIDNIQQIILALRPGPLDDLGLLPALKWYASMRLEPMGVEIDFDVADPQVHLSDEQEITLFRVVQEAINNIVQHAEASRVFLSIRFTDSLVVAQVIDDGQGFEAEEQFDLESGHLGLGLLGMRERVTLIGGRLDIQSTPHTGTQLRIHIPLDRHEAQETQS